MFARSTVLPGGDDRKGRVYVSDLTTGRIRPVSPPPVSRDWVRSAVISADGGTVAFTSEGRSWAGKGFDWKEQVFVVDLGTGALEQVTKAPGGEGGNDPSLYPSLSADGRLVAFQTEATNLHLGPGTTLRYFNQVVLYDRATGRYTLVSARPDGTASPQPDSTRPSLSADGTSVLFTSSSNDLVRGDRGTAFDDVFVRDLRTGTTRLVDLDDQGRQPIRGGDTGVGRGAISSDGTTAVFSAAGLRPARDLQHVNVYARALR